VLDSLRLLGDAMASFATFCVAGIEVNAERTQELLGRSLMLVTSLAPRIGYDRAALIAKHAHREGLSLREAAIAVGGLSGEQFDAWVDARRMLGPG
jgi:fumarate hydratase, class II